jgi:heptosyltransferase-2
MEQTGRKSIERIVVRGTNWVGDAVMTIPALRALRRLLPDAEISLVVRPWAKDLFGDADFIDDLITYDRKGWFSVVPQIREWRRRKFDLALLFQNALEAALIPFLAAVPLRLGYATEGRKGLLSHPVPPPDWRATKHEVFYYLYLVAALEHSLFGTDTVTERDPEATLEISEARKDAARTLLQLHLVGKGNVVAICPGSINSRAKRWPAERYASLADRLIEDHQQVVLIGSQEELDVSSEVVDKMQHKPVVLTGKTNLEQITSVLGVVDLVITNDTGPAHIASALGRPTLVIFGPTNPLTTRPFSAQAEILRHPPDCAPCMLRDCPIDHRCMTAITVDEVFERSRSLLKRGSFARTVRSLCDSVA